MNITYSDQEIAALIHERKVLPYNWHSSIYYFGETITAENCFSPAITENQFRIIARLNDIHPIDFSVILTVIVPLSNRDFRLRRLQRRQP